MCKEHKSIGMAILVMAMPIFLLAFPQKDTAVYLSTSKGKEVKEGSSTFVAMRWKEGNFWHVRNYTYPEKKLQFEGCFDDLDCTKKEGLFLDFYDNGIMEDSGQYLQNKEEGMHYGWHDTGDPSFIEHYKHGILIDTSVGWFKNGKKSMITVVDKDGTGMREEYHDDGKISVRGHLVSGKKSGIWIFTDNNQIVSQKVVFDLDSALTITNYDEKGIEEKGLNQVEKGAEFPGGLKGWQRFLERNLRYPEEAQRNKAQGVVRISLIVDKEGNVTDYKILGNFDKSLEQEALRIMKISPKWIPAVQHNRKVTYRFVQTITFQLQ